MNPNEENNNPLNNPADKPTTAPEPETTPEVDALSTEPAAEPAPETPEPPAPESPEATETLQVPELAPNPVPAAEASAPIVASTSSKKSTTTTLILVIIAALLVIAGVVITVLLIGSNNNSKNSNNQTTESIGNVLVCSASVNKASPETPNDFTAYEAELDAYYDAEGNMTNISLSEDYTFADETAAANYVKDQKTAYNKMLEGLNISSDPFDTQFEVFENDASIYRTADISMINSGNAAIFNLKINEDGTVDTSRDGIEKVYTTLLDIRYTCDVESLESADTEEDLEEDEMVNTETDTEEDEE